MNTLLSYNRYRKKQQELCRKTDKARRMHFKKYYQLEQLISKLRHRCDYLPKITKMLTDEIGYTTAHGANIYGKSCIINFYNVSNNDAQFLLSIDVYPNAYTSKNGVAKEWHYKVYKSYKDRCFLVGITKFNLAIELALNIVKDSIIDFNDPTRYNIALEDYIKIHTDITQVL